MSKPNPSAPFSAAPLLPWALPALMAVTVATAVWSYARVGEVEAAPGSPYYDKAVKEAINGLVNPGGAAAAPAPGTRPALPAGLNPADHYWCEQCKTYHKRDAQGNAQPAAQPAAQGGTQPAAQPAAHPAPELPPLVTGKPPGDYYWCDECLAFHQRPAVPPQPAAADPGAIPPLPDGLNPADYYWCANCKAYHLRKTDQPVHPEGK